MSAPLLIGRGKKNALFEFLAFILSPKRDHVEFPDNFIVRNSELLKLKEILAPLVTVLFTQPQNSSSLFSFTSQAGEGTQQ